MSGLLAGSLHVSENLQVLEFDPDQPRIKGGLGGGRWTKWLGQLEQHIHALGSEDHIELVGGVKITPASPIKHRGAIDNMGKRVDRPATYNVSGGEGMSVRGATKERAAKAAAQRVAKSTAPGTPGGRASIDFADADKHAPPANSMQGIKVARAPAKKFKGHGRVQMADPEREIETLKGDITRSRAALAKAKAMKGLRNTAVEARHADKIRAAQRRIVEIRAANPKNLREEDTMHGRGILAEAQGGTDVPNRPNPNQTQPGPRGQGGGKGFDESQHPRGKKGSSVGGKFVKKGDSGKQVVAIQREIGATPDGTFGKGTQAKLKAYQAKQGIQSDGIAGAQTVGLMRDQTGVAPGALGKADHKFLAQRGSDAGRRPTDPVAKGDKVSASGSVSTAAKPLTAKGHVNADTSKSKGKKDRKKFYAGMQERDFGAAQRDKAASKGAALPDGSFPIENAGDLKNAISAYGRAKDTGKAKAHILKRAKALGLENLLPGNWRAQESHRYVERRGRTNHVLR